MKRKVTFLVAEQNTNMALRYADYGYIMERGGCDDAASDLANNEDVRSFLPWRRWWGTQSLQDVSRCWQGMVGMSPPRSRLCGSLLRVRALRPHDREHSPATAGGIADGSPLTSRHGI
jgi:hypothetical protein